MWATILGQKNLWGRGWGEEVAWLGGEFTAGGGGNSLVLQWLRLCVSTAGGTGFIPVQGTKVPHAMWRDQKRTV